MAAFAVAGLIEGFVTGRPWPTALRVGIGTAAWIAFMVYMVTQGRSAAASGLTGTLGEERSATGARRRTAPSQPAT